MVSQPDPAQPGTTAPQFDPAATAWRFHHARSGSTNPGSTNPGSAQPGDAKPDEAEQGAAQLGADRQGVAWFDVARLETALFLILGHYGSGKTNFALNLAFALEQVDKAPTLIDLDIVNPYFRSTDYRALAQEHHIEVTGPVYGGSNLDSPSLAPGIDAQIARASTRRPVLVDVGGDPDGARALARFKPAISQVAQCQALAVVNFRRPETATVSDNLALLAQLEHTAGIKLDALVGTTHLAEFTTTQVIAASLEPLAELSRLCGLPVLALTVPSEVAPPGQCPWPVFATQRLVRTVWQ